MRRTKKVSKLKRMMFFSHICCPSYITGAENYLLFMLRQLSTMYSSILVVPHEGVLSREAKNLGAEIVVHPYPMLTSLWRPSSTFNEELYKAAQQHVPTLINLMHLYSPDLVFTCTSINPLPALAAKKANIPLAWTISEVIPRNEFTQQSIRLIDQYSDWIIGISKTVLEPFLVDHIPEKTIIIYPSFNVKDWNPDSWDVYRGSLRSQLGIGNNQILIGYISSDIVPHKGLKHFIQMSVELCSRHPHVRYLITGHATDQAYYNECMQMIANSGYTSRFYVTDFEAHIAPFYSSIDILIVPSLISEGFGMTAMEGMAFGKPVVSYFSGGLAEISFHSGNKKTLAKQGDIQQLVQITEHFVVVESDRKEVGRRNQEAAQRIFGIESYQDRLSSFLGVADPIMERNRNIKEARTMMFPNGILFKGSSSAVYLIEKNTKRPFVDGAAFYHYKFKWDNVLHVDDSILNMFPTGRMISSSPPFRLNSPGRMLVSGSDRGVYLLQDDILYAFETQNIFERLKYGFDEVVNLPDAIIHILPKGQKIVSSVLLNHIGVIDGRWFRSPHGDVFCSDQGHLRHISSEKELQFFKCKPDDLIDLRVDEWNAAPKGIPIQI